MVSGAEFRLALQAIERILKSVPGRQRGAWEVMEWLDDHEPFLGFGLIEIAEGVRVQPSRGRKKVEAPNPEATEVVGDGRGYPTPLAASLMERDNGLIEARDLLCEPGRRIHASAIRVARDLLRRAAQEEKASTQPASFRTVANLARLFDLSDDEQKILQFLLLTRAVPTLDQLVDTVQEHGLLSQRRALAAALQIAEPAINRSLEKDSRLVSTGLVKVRDIDLWDRRPRGPTETIVVADGVLAVGLGPRMTQKALRERLLGEPLKADLALADFDHLAADRDLAVRLLQEAAAEGLSGINILLYGPPGTGKTEMAKVLANAAKLNLYPAGAGDIREGLLDRSDRLQHLRQMQALLSPGRSAAILFDEMEDLLGQGLSLISLLSGRSAPTANKGQVHSVLETSAVPVIWTCNDIASFDPALLRRMTHAIHVPIPPAHSRHRVWNRAAERAGLDLGPDVLAHVAHSHVAPPSIAAGALRAAKVLGGDADDVQRLVGGMVTAMAGGQPAAPQLKLTDGFESALVNADTDLIGLADRLAGRAESAGPVTLLLHGPPGTGKSAYGRYLAQRLELDVLIRRASDLLGKFVGETEKAIAQAFAEAREGKALLILDEVDSLLGARASAHQSWEVSRTNEVLTRLESHPLPLGATTNRLDGIDEAALRRFAFKVQWRALTRDQGRRAFLHFFDLEPTAALDHLDGLTPGDFAAVKRKADMLGETDTVILTRWLEHELELKPGRTRRIGF